MFRKLILAILTIAILVGITALIVAFGRGYRFNFQTGKVAPTGLLVASSFPTGAQVYVDDHLVSATNSTIPLPPGNYEVKITKDGYISWQKKLKVQGEVVTLADALLLPIAPILRPITTTGALNPTVSLDGTNLVYGVATASALKQGVWIMNLADRPLSLQSPSKQIARDSEYLKFSTGTFIWSPDNKQIIVKLDGNYYLLSTDGLNESPQDVSLTYDLQFETWIEEETTKQEALVKSLKPKLAKFIKENTKIISWSPDETKILYEATQSATMPEFLTPPLIGSNSQPEEREFETNRLYVYDIKEDKNFYLQNTERTSNQETLANTLEKNYLDLITYHLALPLKWLPDSKHLLLIEKNEKETNEIKIVEYDNTNKATIFASPFEDNYMFPFPSGYRIVILTTLNPSLSPNLYVVDLQ